MRHDCFESNEDDRLNTIGSALEIAHRFFMRRDEMNAEVHCQTPRWSPITERMAEALQAHANYVTDVLETTE